MKRTILIMITVLLAGSSTAQKKNDSAEQVLPLQQFIKSACRNHPTLSRIRADYSAQLLDTRRIKALKDLYLSSSVGLTGKDSVLQYGMEQAKNYRGIDINTVLSKKIPAALGMQAQLQFNWNRLEADVRATSNYQPLKNYTPSLSLSISFPLLANFLGKADRAQLATMHLRLKLLKKAQAEAYQNYLLQLHYIYLDWALLEEKTTIYRGFMNRAGALLGQTVQKQKVGLAEWADIHLTRQNYFQYEALYRTTQLQARQKYLELFNYMHGKPAAAAVLTNNRMRPAAAALSLSNSALPAPCDPAQTRLLQIAVLQHNSAVLSAKSSASLAKPQLNLLLSAGLGGSGAAASDSFDNFNEQSFFAGLEFSHSFGNNDRGNLAKSAARQLLKQQKLLQETRIKIQSALANLRHTAATLQQITGTGEKVVNASRYRINALLGQYAQGRAALQQITDARDIYANARINQLTRIIQLKKTRLELAALRGDLLNAWQHLLP